MRRQAVALLAVLVVCALAGRAHAAAPTADAKAWEVMNASNGQVLASYDAHRQLPMASLTKLMTVIVAMKHLQPDERVTVSPQAPRAGGSRIPLRAGQKITVDDLLKGALIQSANDAADALADAAAGGDRDLFITWMNEEAVKLGLHDSHFVRPDGLDAPGHVSSAHDLGVLAQVAMHSPLFRSIVKKRTDTIENGSFTVHTWNDLLGVFPGLIGVKTGHTDNAGWCEVAAARRQGYTIYAVILGSPSRSQRNADLRRLLAWGVAQYRTQTLVAAKPYAYAQTGYGRPALALAATKPLVRVLAAGSRVVMRITAPSAVKLPVAQGQRLGTIEIRVDGQLYWQRPLVAARSVERPDLGGRLRWYATRTVHDFVGFFS
jgi:D-alanyl-D-alanine carboxypeptidase (penicillin-binding protein 5/6)